MPSLEILSIGVLSLSIGWASGATLPRRQENGTACGQLAARFPESVFAPGSANYTLQVTDEIWSATCFMDPGCVFSPSNENDVADALGIIYDTQTTFSVVSGGHMPVPGAQSNDGGVLISMHQLNGRELNEDQSVASLGPGQRWIEVYDWLAESGLAVAGGRYATVGVGGLITGGGINYFANRHGWSVSTLRGYQVVLGNGTVVEASATENPDLFWALKGGNNNYGIVTRVDMNTFPLTAAYGGFAMWNGTNATTQLIQATEDFILSPEGIEEPDTEINPTIQVLPSESGPVYQGLCPPFVAGNWEGVPPSVANFTRIPNPIVNTITQQSNWVDIPRGINDLISQTGNGQRQMFASVTSRIAPGIVQLAVDTLLHKAAEDLASIEGVSVALSPEPISQTMLQIAADSGEYAIDLDPEEGGFVIMLLSTTWSDEADDETIRTYVDSALEDLRAALRERDLFRSFVYVNDASPDQYPYDTYGDGHGSSVPRMRSVQEAYDPLGVFRELITSGFRL